MVVKIIKGERKYKKFAVISACSFTWLAASALLMQRDIYPLRIIHNTQALTPEEEEIIYQDRQAQIFVFLRALRHARDAKNADAAARRISGAQRGDDIQPAAGRLAVRHPVFAGKA